MFTFDNVISGDRQASLPFSPCFYFDLNVILAPEQTKCFRGKDMLFLKNNNKKISNTRKKSRVQELLFFQTFFSELFFFFVSLFMFDLQLHFIKLLSAAHWSCNNTSQLGGFLLAIENHTVSVYLLVLSNPLLCCPQH